MVLPPEPNPMTVVRGDFLYKTDNNKADWTRLEIPDGVNHFCYDSKHNCYSIAFDSGIILMQTDPRYRSICKVKLLTLEPPVFKIEGEQLILEAKCVKMFDPVFESFDNWRNKGKAVKRASNVPLAQLDKKITDVRLQNFCSFKYGMLQTNVGNIHELEKRMHAMVNHDPLPSGAAQSNGSGPAQTTNGGATTSESSRSSTEPAQMTNGCTDKPGPSSSSTGPSQLTNGRTTGPGPGQTTNGYTAGPDPSSGISMTETPATNNGPAQTTNFRAAAPGMYMTQETAAGLQELREAHDRAMAEEQGRLIQGLEKQREKMQVFIRRAMNAEYDRQQEDAVAEHRAEAENTRLKKEAEWRASVTYL